MSWFTFLIWGMLLLLTLIDSTNVLAAQMTGVHESADIAINKIQQAEYAGAEVSDLISRFNVAMDLLEQAESSKFISCGSYEECIQNAEYLFASIASDAVALEEQAEKIGKEELLDSTIYATIGAFAIAFLGMCLYRLGRFYQRRAFLDMEIEEKRT